MDQATACQNLGLWDQGLSTSLRGYLLTQFSIIIYGALYKKVTRNHTI